MPAEKNSAVDAFAIAGRSAKLQAFIEVLHQGVFLIKPNSFDRGRDVRRLGAVEDLEQRLECDVL